MSLVLLGEISYINHYKNMFSHFIGLH